MAENIQELNLKLEVLELTYEALLIKLDAFDMVDEDKLPELLMRYQEEYSDLAPSIEEEQPIPSSNIEIETPVEPSRIRRVQFVIQRPFDEWGISRKLKRLIKDEPTKVISEPETYTFEENIERKGPLGSSLNDAKKVASQFLDNDKVIVNELVIGSRSRATVLHYLKNFKSAGYIVYQATEDEKYYSITEAGQSFFKDFVV